MGSNEVCSDYLDFLVLPDLREPILNEMLSFLSNDGFPFAWDWMDLTDIPSESFNLPIIENFFRSYITKRVDRYSVCPYLDLRGAWDEIFATFSPQLRKNIKYQMRSLKKNYSLEFRELDNTVFSQEDFDAFVRLNKLRMSDRGIRSPFEDVDFKEFHKLIFYELCQLKSAAIYFLIVDGMPSAGIYLFFDHERCYFYQSGFDHMWRKYSPGSLLFYYTILSAYDHGLKEFDFLRGDEDYKFLWTRNKRINSRFVIYNKTAKGLINYKFKSYIDKSKHVYKFFCNSLKLK